MRAIDGSWAGTTPVYHPGETMGYPRTAALGEDHNCSMARPAPPERRTDNGPSDRSSPFTWTIPRHECPTGIGRRYATHSVTRQAHGQALLTRYVITGIMPAEMKSLKWVGSTIQDLREFPDAVRSEIGYALYLAQIGEKHPDAKPLRGFGGAGVLEVVEDFDGNT